MTHVVRLFSDSTRCKRSLMAACGYILTASVFSTVFFDFDFTDVGNKDNTVIYKEPKPKVIS